MLFRFRARNYPDTLSMEETRLWDKDRKARLADTEDPAYFTLSDFKAATRELREQKQNEPQALEILDQLDSWVIESGISAL